MMLNLMAIPHVLHITELILVSRRANNCGGHTFPFSLYNQSTTALLYISDHQTTVGKSQESDIQTGSRDWTSRCLRQRGGGIDFWNALHDGKAAISHGVMSQAIWSHRLDASATF